MAKFKQEYVAKFQTTLDSDIEETGFAPGDEVRIVATWARHYLIKDGEGHFYNIPKEVLDG